MSTTNKYNEDNIRNISGTKQSINCMVLVKVLLAAAALLKKQQRKQVQASLLNQQRTMFLLRLAQAQQIRLQQPLKNRAMYSEKYPFNRMGIFSF